MSAHLWEVDHPYYCNESNYFKNGHAFECESWAEFYKSMGNVDLDMNLVFRWDWNRPDPADYEYEIQENPDFEMPGDYLQLFYMGQRKGYFYSYTIQVSEADETAVRAFLEPYAALMRALWSPLLGADS